MEMWQGSQLLRLSQMTGAACRRRYSCTRARTRFLHEPNVTLVLYRCSPGACVASSKAVAKAQMKTHRRGRAMKLATSDVAAADGIDGAIATTVAKRIAPAYMYLSQP